MRPPMPDTVVLRKPTGLKDGRGLPVTDEFSTPARVVEESTTVLDTDGKERQSAFTVMLPTSTNPSLNDEITITDRDGNETRLSVIKRKPRMSYSGKKVYYWVVSCGE